MPTASSSAARFPVPAASSTGAPPARPSLRAVVAALAAAPPYPAMWLFAPTAAWRSFGGSRER